MGQIFNLLRRYSLFPALDDRRLDDWHADGASDDGGDLLVGVDEGGGERGHVDGVADRLVARRVDDVAQRLLRVLDGAAFRISVAKKDQFLKNKTVSIECPCLCYPLSYTLN